MDRTAVGAVSGDIRRDRRGGRPLPLFSEVPLRRLRKNRDDSLMGFVSVCFRNLFSCSQPLTISAQS